MLNHSVLALFGTAKEVSYDLQIFLRLFKMMFM